MREAAGLPVAQAARVSGLGEREIRAMEEDGSGGDLGALVDVYGVAVRWLRGEEIPDLPEDLRGLECLSWEEREKIRRLLLGERE